MRALVISGGGSKGAFGGGIAEYLIKECRNKYDLFLGTSVGSLLIPLLSIGEIDRLKTVFTTITQNDVFNTHPFIVTKNNGEFRTRINHFGIVKMFFKGKKTFGESENLRRLIRKTITKDDFKRMQDNESDVIVTVSNLSCNSVEYKSLNECTYLDYCDWIWASASVVPFMSLVEKNGFEYADGGMGNIVPVYEAIMRGATEIDVILFKSDKRVLVKPARNALEITGRVFDFMLNQIESGDIILAKCEGIHRKVQLNFFQPQEELTINSLIFDPVQMTRWWEQGFKYAKTQGPSCKNLTLH